MSEKREIRFIDVNYKELFRIPDGGHIVVTRPMSEMYPGVQEQWVGVCEYCDESHVRINGEIYHICQFAEIQQRIGSTVEPEAEPEYIGGYRITARTIVDDKTFKYGYNPSAATPYATWQCFKGEDDRNSFGHYWSDKSIARRDFFLRADAERTGRHYDHTTLIKQQKNRNNERV
jgi:hypothetical protein